MARDTIAPLMASYRFTLHRSSGKHLIWRHASGAQVATSKTPSDRRNMKNTERDIRRALAAVPA